MLINIESKQIIKANIEPEEAFRILCKTLGMNYIVEENDDIYVSEDESGNKLILENVDGYDYCIDDRGDLFIALCNVAVNIFPNSHFRSADFIYSNGKSNIENYNWR